jgi:type VI protein secretion system component VasF
VSDKHHDHHPHGPHHAHGEKPPRSPYPFWFMALGTVLIVLVLLVWLLSQ